MVPAPSGVSTAFAKLFAVQRVVGSCGYTPIGFIVARRSIPAVWSVRVAVTQAAGEVGAVDQAPTRVRQSAG